MKPVMIIAASLLFLLALAPSAYAAGLGLSPSIFSMTDLARGATYEKHLKVLNLNDYPQRFTVNASGPARAWISFVSEGNRTPIPVNLTAPANGEFGFIAIITVPSDAPNGGYNGTIDIEPNLEGTGHTATVIVQGLYSLAVTGAESRSANVASITVADAESGQPVRFAYDVRNTGNVGIVPHAKVDVSNKGGTYVSSAAANGTYVAAGSTSREILEWDSENHGVGNFTGTVTVTLGNSTLATKTLSFAILPRGTFTASAVVGKVSAPEDLTTGTIGKLTVPVYNTGKIDVQAKVTTEVTYGGKLVDVVSSDEALVPAGGSGELELYFTPQHSGAYTLTGRVVYSGKETALAPMTVKVSDPGAVNREAISGTGSGTRIVIMVLAVLVAVLLVTIGIVAWRFTKK